MALVLVVSLVVMDLPAARSVQHVSMQEQQKNCLTLVFVSGFLTFSVDRVPLVSVEPLAQWDPREPPASLEAPVLPVHLDPRWVLQHTSFQGQPSRVSSDVHIGFVFLLKGVTGSPGSPGPDGKVGPAVSFVSQAVMF